MSEVAYVIRKDVATRDLAGRSVIVSGNMQLDAPNSRILLGDGSNNRILLEGLSGLFKISRAGYNVLTTGNTNLLLSSEFGSVVEAHYRLTDQHRYTNSTTYIYHGPDNATTETPDPISIRINDTDYKDVALYLEANMSGQDSAYCQARLYNVTDGVEVTNSVIVSPTGSIATRVRSTTSLALTSGIKEYAVQYKRVDGDASDYPGIYEAHLVARIST